MNYEKIYYNLIQTRKQLNRKKTDKTIYEKHHIIPRGCGGDDSSENLILLTLKEHFFAHLMLVEFYTGENKSKMLYALWWMGTQTKKYGDKIISSRHYAYLKQLILEDRQSKPNKLKNKTWEDIYGIEGAKLIREKQSKAHKGQISPMTGKTHSEETKKKMKEKRKLQVFAKESIKKRNKSLCKPVLQIDKITGNIIQEFNSIKEAQQILKIPGGISFCLKNKQRSIAGFKWRYKNEQ
jgi:hypothetical protein